METLLRALEERRNILGQIKSFAGFDGFIDRIMRPIQQINGDKNIYFKTIEEYGNFLIQKSGKSCSIEMDMKNIKLGGNMPIFANAFAGFGVPIHSMGMLGENSIHNVFQNMPDNCILHSYREPVYSDCLEFTDGKIMMAARCDLTGDIWSKLKKAMNSIEDYVPDCDLTAMLNWSELLFANDLWESFYLHCFAHTKPDNDKIIFFDLCDCSRKENQDIINVLNLIGKFSNVRQTVLSMNDNEALIVGASLPEIRTDLHQIALYLSEMYSINQVVIHTIHSSYVYAHHTWLEIPTFFCKEPLISTGAGDNFNAGYCLGCVLELDIKQRLLLGNMTSSFYIQHGYSASYDALIDYFNLCLE